MNSREGLAHVHKDDTVSRVIVGNASTITLRDGRRLAYLDAPAPVGAPVLFLHGLPSCRLMRPDDRLTAQLGARLISFDRPGFGRSDPRPGRSLGDTADDIVALIDSLGIDRTYVAAPSGGGPAALAFAHRAPDRIRAVALIGAVGPIDSPGALAGITFERRVGFWLARHLPSMLRWTIARRTKGGRDMNAFFDSYTKHNPPVDQAILARPEIREMFLASYTESLRQGADAFAWEVQLTARPWGFPLSAIRVPVAVWHGGQDNSIPPVMGKRIATAIPGAQLHLRSDESHLFFLSRWHEILSDLLSLG
jgi:pimeloyl-ACP methyl ester carboxylesterase